MKFYEKPMAIIEAIEVEDVITTSESTTIEAKEKDALKAAAGLTANDEVILFQW